MARSVALSDTVKPDALGARPRAVRTDIQWLRAVAVGLVLLFHLWPLRVSGGYIGVDVFFVISGFLITTHLFERPPRSGSGLLEFWNRRIRRLLPVSFLVLGLTLIASVFILPMTQWGTTVKSIGASAVYLQNWNLADSAVNYLAADEVPTAAQHFWSLSVEEQFYIVWPLVFFIVALLTRRAPALFRKVGALAVALVLFASLAYSIYFTSVDAAAAYFVTTTRMWELAFGGLLAAVYPTLARLAIPPVVRALLAWTGLAAIIYAALTYTSLIPFPGYHALLPVAGTALVIAVGPTNTSAFSPERIGARRPVQYLGDISYSVYLWHWPIIVFVPYLTGHELTWPEKLLILVITIALSGLSKKYVEDRFRGKKPLGAPLRRGFIFTAIGMLVFVVATASIWWYVEKQTRDAENELQEQVLSANPCLGAGALMNPGCGDPHGEKLLMDPVAAKADKSPAYADGCWSLGDLSERPRCDYGSTEADARRVALIGNSHAGHWLPALTTVANENNLKITTFLASECYTILEPIEFDNQSRTANCLGLNRAAIDEIKQESYDMVVISNRMWRTLQGVPAARQDAELRAGFTKVLKEFSDAGIPVLVLHDTPYAEDVGYVPDCIAENTGDLAACDGTLAAREVKDQLYDAAVALNDPLVATADLTDTICRGETCYSTVGGLIVYFDIGHLTATFCETLAPYIEEPVLGTLTLGSDPSR